MAEIAGLRGAVAERLALAVDEAATNVIEHAYNGAPDREVELRFEDRGRDFRSSSWTRAAWWTRARCPRSTSTRSSRERRTGGLGMHLMEKIMDSRHVPALGAPQRLRLVKHKDEAAGARDGPLMRSPRSSSSTSARSTTSGERARRAGARSSACRS